MRKAPMTERFWIGSDAHKQVFCRVFLGTHDSYRPAIIPWPTLSTDAIQRLTALPIWDVAVETEGNAALRMACFAETLSDPLVRQAAELNAFEEQRHKDVLQRMVNFYGIKLTPERAYKRPKDPLWGFLRTGFGELLDSFFAFGLFVLGKRSGFFPAELVQVFEPVIQEEARHDLFFVNWLAWEKGRRGFLSRLVFSIRCAAALGVQICSRLGSAKGVDGNNFTRKGGEAIGMRLGAQDLLSLCLSEHERRLSLYDPRLLRPRLMPGLARLALRLMPRKRPALAPLHLGDPLGGGLENERTFQVAGTHDVGPRVQHAELTILSDGSPTPDPGISDPKPGATATPPEDAEEGCAVCGAPIDLEALKQQLGWD